jgi:hypothetical protein
MHRMWHKINSKCCYFASWGWEGKFYHKFRHKGISLAIPGAVQHKVMPRILRQDQDEAGTQLGKKQWYIMRGSP